jgi:hypothetical protein
MASIGDGEGSSAEWYIGDELIGAQDGGTSAGPLDLLNRGNIMLADQDLAGALAAYQAVQDSGHEEWAPIGAIYLGDLLDDVFQDTVGASAAYETAMRAGHAE